MNFLDPGSRDMFDANNKAVDYLFRALCHCWRWISVNLEYLLYIGFDYDLELTCH
jgi:hypothetical protein